MAIDNEVITIHDNEINLTEAALIINRINFTGKYLIKTFYYLCSLKKCRLLQNFDANVSFYS